MRKYFIEPYLYEEFNQYISTPVECDLRRKHFDSDAEYYTFAVNDFIALNNAFDKILVYDGFNLIDDHFQILGNADAKEIEQLVGEKMNYDEIKIKITEFCKKEQIDYKTIVKKTMFDSQEWHPYEYNYRMLSRNMQERSFIPFLTTKEKYDEYSKYDKMIVVNGRNYSGDKKGQQFRNNLFIGFITSALKKGFVVINVTDLKPNLDIQDENYIEIDNRKIVYFDKIAMFQNALGVVSLANGGGITTHLCTKANFYCFGLTDNMDDRWADNNQRYGYNRKSIADSRREMWPDVKTNFYHSPEYYSKRNLINDILEEIESLKKPEINEFFDENKIVKL